MTTAVLLLTGLLLLALSVWSRRGRTDGARWWVGTTLAERGVLLVFPGLAVVLLSAAGLQGYEPVVHAGRLWFGLPLALGLLVCAYGTVGLPLPRGVEPAWLVARRTRARR
ncbi:MAG: hypothetical protein JWN17_1189 [Frankiales bacterium]|nr:hypothetical protein [Frankiales bacterium]